MIGLADRNQVFELFENLAVGKVDKVISNLQEQYKNGANPTTLLQDLINITHMLAKARIIPASVNDVSLTENERGFCTKMTPVVSIAVLSKIWQMLIKGIGELQVAPVQIDALEMILIRVAYSASLPTPYELLNDVKKNSSLGSSRPLKQRQVRRKMHLRLRRSCRHGLKRRIRTRPRHRLLSECSKMPKNWLPIWKPTAKCWFLMR